MWIHYHVQTTNEKVPIIIFYAYIVKKPHNMAQNMRCMSMLDSENWSGGSHLPIL